jgi:hypothetical protein
METSSDGSKIFRNEKSEEKAAREHQRKSELLMEDANERTKQDYESGLAHDGLQRQSASDPLQTDRTTVPLMRCVLMDLPPSFCTACDSSHGIGTSGGRDLLHVCFVCMNVVLIGLSSHASTLF